jgi:2-keto-4-pentenoate hydratase/2-oxohepta-3-ene-1,7-dioic acid hydratase in catechol pathway
MQFARFSVHGSAPQWGVVHGDHVHSLAAHPAGEPDYGDIANPSYRADVEAAVDDRALPTAPADDVDYLSPVARPGKIVCVGLNYHDHAEEQNEEVPERPLLFAKAPTTVTNPGDPIVHPGGDEQVDYEVELGIVIGRTAKDVSYDEAADYIAGYTVVNDVSGRYAQIEQDAQFYRGKSFDTFSPMGPVLTAGGDFDPNDAAVATRVNGDTKQDSTTAEFIFDVYDVVEYISANQTLRPGDVISTGTPGGVGIFRDPPDLLEPGDTVVAEIDGTGAL